MPTPWCLNALVITNKIKALFGGSLHAMVINLILWHSQGMSFIA